MDGLEFFELIEEAAKLSTTVVSHIEKGKYLLAKAEALKLRKITHTLNKSLKDELLELMENEN